MRSPRALFCFALWSTLCALVTSPTSAQWYWQNPLPQGNSLLSIVFVNSQIGWTGGTGGSFLKTTDGGNSWEVVTLPTRIDVQTVFFIDEQVGWIGGQPTLYPEGRLGMLLGTTDGGRTWKTQLEDSIGDFVATKFVNVRQGWAAGHRARIHHTTDGGQTWQLQSDFYPSVFGEISSLSFIDSLRGWCVGSSVTTAQLLRTTNGGESWAVDTTLSWIQHVTFLDSLAGWLYGIGRIARVASPGDATFSNL